eukprot:TRINITY_DN2630_c0_g2_i1.p1 TRINITY_DN2630_c0_g2~~TRINITY_DN2630_c0_g2_i1.p1  ORF type:complete len:705 (-),score=244.58 TRINITY_DN2630_c0_g2_i1:53-2167(-)
MQVLSMPLLCVVAVISLLSSPVVSVKTVRTHSSASAKANGDISKIVKELKKMADKSQEDGEAEAKTFGDYSCHTKKTIANKTAWIEASADEIETLEIKTERGVAKKAELQSKVAQLEKDIADNSDTQKQTTAVRNNSRKAFVEENKSMSSALAELADAYKVLSSNGTSLLQLMQSPSPLMVSVARQLLAVSKAAHQDFLAPKAQQEQEPVLLDMGAPGEYDRKSDGVLGVLQSTRDSYAKNLQDLQAEEAKQLASYEDMMKKLKDKEQQLKQMKTSANEDIAQTTADLVAFRKDLQDEQATKDAQTKSKDELESVLAQKTKAYEDRKLLRSQEDSAISKAISILNSDDAFASLNKDVVPDSFMQLTASASSEMMQRRHQVISYLRSQAHLSRSARLARLAVFMSREEPENPFDKVMKEIAEMKDVIDKEAKSDKKKFDSCVKDRKENQADIDEQESIINAQDKKITADTSALGSVKGKTGLENNLKESQDALAANLAEQEDITKARTKENQDYQQDIADLQVAQNLVSQAIKVLKTYYDKIALVQEDTAGATTTAEPTYEEKKFEGQGSAGASVLKLMDTMLSNTKDAETKAHKDEHKAQTEFEDSMKTETNAEEKLKKNIADKKKEIAEKHLALDESNVLLAGAKKQKAACEQYLLEIKPGCDFITTNLDIRNTNRAAEKDSLDNAITLIKGTPAYKSFESEQ